MKPSELASKANSDIPGVLWIGALAKGLIGRDGASLPVAGIVVLHKALFELNRIEDFLRVSILKILSMIRRF